LALAGTLAAFVGFASPAAAQEPCVAAVDGNLIEGHGPGNPLEFDADAEVLVEAIAPADAERVRVEVVLPFVTTRVIDDPVAPGTVFRDTVDLGDAAPYGVGLYRVEVEAGDCSSTVWVRLTGRSPFTTVTGIVATGAFVGGLGLVIWGVVRAVNGKRGIVPGLVGGAIGGFGALVLAQQHGWVGMTDRVLITWIGFPALGGVAITQVSALLSGGAGAAAPAPVPAPAPAPVPPPAAPAPVPPPSAPVPPPTTAAPAPPPAIDFGVPPPEVPVADPPRSAYARIDAPEAVVAEEEFELVVGLAPEPVAGVVGGPLVRPESSVGPYTLVVQVVADGFTLRNNLGGWRRELPVTAEAPYPTVTYLLRADRQAAEVWSRSVQALFSVDGQTMGMAVRSVAIVARAELLGVLPAPPEPVANVMTVAPQRDAADLTVRILRGESPTDGRLLWTFETTLGVDVPDEPVATDIGARPADFARQLIAGVASHRGRPTLVPFLTGIGHTVSEQVPNEFFDVLAAVATRVEDRPPRVLLLSEEPYVPWELAVLDPPIDATGPPFLGAQCDVGRWVLGQRRPPLPPPPALEVADLAVVTGVYPSARDRLVDAEEEAAEIAQRWSAVPVDAVAVEVIDCLAGTPPADVLHFAVHGSYAPDGVLEGLLLVDGDTLDPMAVKGTTFARTPFVFLNACQVGSSNEVLGDYAGLAAAFLHAGASAVIAPLWSIDDAAAKDLALRFYNRVFDDGLLPASVLRDERREFAGNYSDGAATRLAYQFFGHPALAVRVRHPTARREP
jgi:hypothetical protein